MEGLVFPGQRVQLSGDGYEVFNVTPVVPGKTQKRANFRGVLGGLISLTVISWRGGGRVRDPVEAAFQGNNNSSSSSSSSSIYLDIRLYIISKYRSAAEVKNLYGSTVNS